MSVERSPWSIATAHSELPCEGPRGCACLPLIVTGRKLSVVIRKQEALNLQMKHTNVAHAYDRKPHQNEAGLWTAGTIAILAQRIRSSWATKVSEIGQQALVGAEGAKESQGRKDHGIRRP